MDTDLVKTAIEYALCQGLVMLNKEGVITHAPLTLRPSPFPRAAFDSAQVLATDFNTLLVNIANDIDFLSETVNLVAPTDEFIRRLYDIYRTVYIAAEAPQPLSLGIFRSDYLRHPADAAAHLRQVEINTIASAFAGLSAHTTALHQFMQSTVKTPVTDARGDIPPNASLSESVKGLAEAWRLYGCSDAVIGFVVQAGERNIFDQKHLEYALWHEHHIRVVRVTLSQVAEYGRLKHGRLRLIHSGDEVAVVYFRAGYTPGDYPSQREWDARLLLEQSAAIKCPSMNCHLSGLKKVQEALCSPAILQQFLPNQTQLKRVRACFANFFSLHDKDTVQNALASPQHYVLKPQREGGGNNIYGEALAQAIENMTPEEKNKWVLMERIHAPAVRNILIHDNQATTEMDVVNELGIFSVCIARGREILHNTAAGYLLRTKPVAVDEGGVASGFAVLDSPALSETTKHAKHAKIQFSEPPL
ncbi:MAG: glutathione synthase [Gammaproteobacteria bacterium]|nr:glutathione synthase [Gammaproteobacteria bacterium]